MGHESQASSFRDFLLRANRYPSLDIFQQDQQRQRQQQGQVILVEVWKTVLTYSILNRIQMYIVCCLLNFLASSVSYSCHCVGIS